MPAGETLFPTGVDSDANLPDLTGYRWSGYLHADGVTYDEDRRFWNWANTIRRGLFALMAKVGVGSSTPSAGRLLQGQASGSAWVTPSSIDLATFGRGSATALQVPRVNAGGTAVEWAANTPADNSVTSAKIVDGSIVNADINAGAAIAKSKLAALAIVNADVDAAAAIAESKLALASDAAAGTASRRTLGTGATQAAAGNHAGHYTQQAAITSLTDSTGGTADNTLAAIPDPADTPATADVLRDDLVANALPAIRNDLADLTAKVNSILTAARAAGWLAT